MSLFQRAAGVLVIYHAGPSLPKRCILHKSSAKNRATPCRRSASLPAPRVSQRPLRRGGQVPVRVAAETVKESETEKKKLEEPDGNGILIPVDLYKLLKGASESDNPFESRRVNSTEILKRNYESISKNAPNVGYARATIESRSRILDRVSEILLDSELRRDYDQKVSSSSYQGLQVSVADLPGAIALIQECGESEKVIELGSQWLNSNKSDLSLRDVVLSVALAYCDLASEALTLGQGLDVCCQELETALELCMACNVALNLQDDIREALRELGPQYVLESLALAPTAENAERRSRGMEQLKNLVWSTSESSSLTGNERDAFMQRARIYLTAAEQIQLYEIRPVDADVPIEEMYDTAMAYVAEGYWAKWPQHITEAVKVLKKIQISTLGSAVPGMDVSVEMGLCSLLLGESEKAISYLGISPDSLKEPDPGVLAFIQENSPTQEDLLPGVCALAERWLTDNIIPNYRGTNNSSNSLGEWFQSPRVSVYLRVLERGKDLNLLSAASIAMNLSSSVARGISTAVSKTVLGIKDVFKKPKTRAQKQKVFNNGKFILPPIHIPRVSESGRLELHPVNNQVSNIIASDGFPSTADAKAETKDQDINAKWFSSTENDASDPLVEKSNESVLEKTWFKLAMTLGIVVTVIANGMMMMPNSTTNKTSRKIQKSTPSSKQLPRSIQKFLNRNSGTMDVPLAEELVRRWHNVKSDALGSEHQTEKLAEILEGNMLKQWKERANYIKKDGWHWEYSLLDLSVDKVSVGRDGRHATIEANIKEKAELIDSGRKADWYSTSYTVQYELVMKKQGWKISAARVVYES